MTDSATSLERLHNLVLPPDVPWWPLAPGWYAVFALALAAATLLGRRAWKRRQANAYRRDALRELATLRDAPAIAELLRRTALAIAPRPVVAAMTGTAWTNWLAAQSPETLPPEVRRLLSVGVYSHQTTGSDLGALRDYAARWIVRHRRDASDIRRHD